MDSKDFACAETGCQLTQLGLLQMPREILEKVLTYLTFDEISGCRQVLNARCYFS